MREVRYFTSKVAIISLSAFIVRKVTGSEIIGCSARKAMRKVRGDAHGRRNSGGRVNKGERAARVEPGHGNQRQYKQNKQSCKHQTKFVFLTIIFFFLCQVYWRPNNTSCSIKLIFSRENKFCKIPANWNSKQIFRYLIQLMYYTLEL